MLVMSRVPRKTSRAYSQSIGSRAELGGIVENFKKVSLNIKKNFLTPNVIPKWKVLAEDGIDSALLLVFYKVQKSNLRSTSIQCYLWPILNCHFFSILNESGTYFFILSCISAHLPKTEASHWEDVIVELNHISTITKGRNIDTTLYTESNAHPSCKITMMRCFLLELHVISYECNNTQLYQAVENILVLANDGLSSNRNIKESGCKECEELEEKNVEEFLQSFIRIVQLFIGTS